MILGYLLGAIIAYAVTKSLFLAFVGAIAGNFLFRRLMEGGLQGLHVDKVKVDATFFKTIFPLMGFIAKSDGHVSESEIHTTQQLFEAMHLDQDRKKQAIELFQAGVKDEVDVHATVQEFVEVCANLSNLKQLLLVYLISLAYADGELHEQEEQALGSIAKQLGFSSFAFNQLLGMVKAQYFFEQRQQSSQTRTQESTLEHAYKALGVSAESTDKEVKTAYRKLMSQYHPDKLAGQGVPQHVIEVATEKSQEVQAAYEAIKTTRPNMR